ncbi:protein-L-isoaspartate(D-aspartate) O-methyltransferase [Parapedobacter lycopersici]|uniref:protein-L-isoaspartate(D-aspartate) O-methyltransferase n=1 Tax=Parapedobacter lycopersici TaxID=1864939 RepID=UPI00333F7893
MCIKTYLPALIVLATYQQALPQDFGQRRAEMVSLQLEPRGINHAPTLEAMRKVERHRFVPPACQQDAYRDMPLPIGYGQTISQPFMVAMMTQLLQPAPDDRILEIGTGSGYQAAILAEMAGEVYTMEIVPQLGAKAKQLLSELGYKNVTVIVGDGYNGWAEKAPYDAIIVTAAPEEVPPPLIAQLKEGGKIIVPVGAQTEEQTLVLIEKRNGELVKTALIPVRFVPFTRSKDMP